MSTPLQEFYVEIAKIAGPLIPDVADPQNQLRQQGQLVQHGTPEHAQRDAGPGPWRDTYQFKSQALKQVAQAASQTAGAPAPGGVGGRFGGLVRAVGNSAQTTPPAAPGTTTPPQAPPVSARRGAEGEQQPAGPRGDSRNAFSDYFGKPPGEYRRDTPGKWTTNALPFSSLRQPMERESAVPTPTRAAQPPAPVQNPPSPTDQPAPVAAPQTTTQPSPFPVSIPTPAQPVPAGGGSPAAPQPPASAGVQPQAQTAQAPAPVFSSSVTPEVRAWMDSVKARAEAQRRSGEAQPTALTSTAPGKVAPRPGAAGPPEPGSTTFAFNPDISAAENMAAYRARLGAAGRTAQKEWGALSAEQRSAMYRSQRWDQPDQPVSSYGVYSGKPGSPGETVARRSLHRANTQAEAEASGGSRDRKAATEPAPAEARPRGREAWNVVDGAFGAPVTQVAGEAVGIAGNLAETAAKAPFRGEFGDVLRRGSGSSLSNIFGGEPSAAQARKDQGGVRGGPWGQRGAGVPTSVAARDKAVGDFMARQRGDVPAGGEAKGTQRGGIGGDQSIPEDQRLIGPQDTKDTTKGPRAGSTGAPKADPKRAAAVRKALTTMPEENTVTIKGGTGGKALKEQLLAAGVMNKGESFSQARKRLGIKGSFRGGMTFTKGEPGKDGKPTLTQGWDKNERKSSQLDFAARTARQKGGFDSAKGQQYAQGLNKRFGGRENLKGLGVRDPKPAAPQRQVAAPATRPAPVAAQPKPAAKGHLGANKPGGPLNTPGVIGQKPAPTNPLLERPGIRKARGAGNWPSASAPTAKPAMAPVQAAKAPVVAIPGAKATAGGQGPKAPSVAKPPQTKQVNLQTPLAPAPPIIKKQLNPKVASPSMQPLPSPVKTPTGMQPLPSPTQPTPKPTMPGVAARQGNPRGPGMQPLPSPAMPTIKKPKVASLNFLPGVRNPERVASFL